MGADEIRFRDSGPQDGVVTPPSARFVYEGERQAVLFFRRFLIFPNFSGPARAREGAGTRGKRHRPGAYHFVPPNPGDELPRIFFSG